MLGIKYKKAPPTVHVLYYTNGILRRDGPGLSFLYFAPTSTIVDVPLSTADVPFIFQEVTADFQPVTLQGQLTYRINDPGRAAGLLDFSVSAEGLYLSDNDPLDLLAQRLTNAAQTIAKTVTQQLLLRAVLSGYETIEKALLNGLRSDETVLMLGVQVLGLSILSIKPTPETAKALEAEAREALLRQADQAIYLRRNAAVEEERRIKESELNTEIAVELKRREIRETRMQADIALEEQRSTLIDSEVENERKHADSRAYALETTLRPLRDADWRTLMAVAVKEGDPRFAIALAFQELAENAGKIGQLNVTPDLLKELLATPEK